jgi:hypothetical protein
MTEQMATNHRLRKKRSRSERMGKKTTTADGMA